MEVKTTLSKWGNSPAVRLPVALMKTAELAVGNQVKVIAERGRIIIEPVEVIEYDIKTLVASLPKDYRPKEFDFGAVQGREVW
jgi:antitoxin MazE